MITDYDIYVAFRQAQALSKNRPYRLPKDWESYKTTMSEANIKGLEKAVVYFNTTYSNIDLLEYMKCGFEVYKGLNYTNFLKPNIIQHYISKDKSKKRQMESSVDDIDNSFSYIKSYMSNKKVHTGYSRLQSFCKFRTGEIRDIVLLYNKNKIDQMTLVYCLFKRYIVLNDDERPLVPYISQRYRELCDNLHDVIDHIKECEDELNETK